MKYAVLSDIHSNWEALETALEYLAKEKIGEYWVLGDSIGYGADPNKCFCWVLENARVALMGNHEQAAVDPQLREYFNGYARTAIEWTADVLKEEYKKKIAGLRYLHITPSVTLAHGSPNEPKEFRYLLSSEEAHASFRVLETPICFVGHTHIPSRFTASSEEGEYLPPGRYPLKKKERYILNPGSVGQPRDQDPRLSFGIFDDEDWAFEIVRLKYDNEKAAAKIRKAGLPAYLADRLL